jgi:hypothetical protein
MKQKDACFAQGARCGHIEGRNRAGSYVIGEEIDLAWEAADNQPLTEYGLKLAWASGYRLGYLLAAEGSPLPDKYHL